MRPATLFAPMRDFFLLERADRTVASYAPSQRARVAELRAAGDERLRASRRVQGTVAACVLLRASVAAFARARAASLDASLGDADLARIDPAQLVPDLPPDVLDGRTGDADRARAALASHDPLSIDRLAPDERFRTRVALERVARALRGSVEVRSRAHVRALRWGRFAAILVVAAWAIWFFAVRPRRMVNLAAGKPVHASSLVQNPPDGHELVDGDSAFCFGVQTNKEDSPNVVIDLVADVPIDHINVYNRSDGWWNDCLPLVVELSRDGKTYTELARRDEYFGYRDPWVVHAGERWARFVRLRVARKSYLALGQVEVFGKRP
jgi:hypothetical protein